MLKINSQIKNLYIDHDEESFEFHNKHLTDNEYMEQWKKSLIRLHESKTPILLPTYLEYYDNQIDLQGYAIYPYESAWVLIDSGVRMPEGDDLADSYKYLPALQESLPKHAKTWQSHWWLTGDDLESLAKEVGASLVFAKGVIPTWPLRCYRNKSHIDIYADKTHFSINFSSFDNGVEAQAFAREQMEDFVTGKNDTAVLPASVEDGELSLYILFKDDHCEYIAQSYSSSFCEGNVVDLKAVEAWRKSKDRKPYIVKKRPLVYIPHARYSSGTAVRLLEMLI